MAVIARSLHRIVLPNFTLRTLHTSNEFCRTKARRFLRQVNLHRPNDGNRINFAMADELYALISAWEENDLVTTIMLSSDLDTFCGGIDLEAIEKTPKKASSFYKRFYHLVYLTSTLNKHGISFFTGPVYGSGFGIVNTQHRFVSEYAKFSVPDLSYGLCLEGGLSYILPRLSYPLPMELARYLIFTGSSLNFLEMLGTGLGTDYFDPKSLFEIEKLFSIVGSTAIQRPDDLLHSFALCGASNYSKRSKLQPKKTPIGESLVLMQCFSGNTVEEIINKLLQNESEWAKTALEKIMQIHPLNLKIAFEQLNRGRDDSLVKCLLHEYLISVQMLDGKFMNITQIGKVWTPKERRKQFPKWWTSISEYLQACENIDNSMISEFIDNLTQYIKRYPFDLDVTREEKKYTPNNVNFTTEFDNLNYAIDNSEYGKDQINLMLRKESSVQRLVDIDTIGDDTYGAISNSLTREKVKNRFLIDPFSDKN